MWKPRALVLLAVFSVLPLAASAKDAWDQATTGDQTPLGANTLIHGVAQTHDLEASGTADVDYFRIPVRVRQSFEVRAYGASVFFEAPPAMCQAGTCILLARTDVNGIPVQQAARVEGDGNSVALRWTASTTETELVRVTGPTTASTFDQYTITALNTTLFAPRFNNSATQSSILVLENTTTVGATGSIDFWSADGTLLHGEPFTVPARGGLVLNTAVLTGVAGQSGSVSISQDAGYAGLVGKIVAVEPATGFTFDTAVTPIPR